jgi:hypothetical protein
MIDTLLNLIQVLCLLVLIFAHVRYRPSSDDKTAATDLDTVSKSYSYYHEEDGQSPPKDEETEWHQDQEIQTAHQWIEKSTPSAGGSSAPGPLSSSSSSSAPSCSKSANVLRGYLPFLTNNATTATDFKTGLSTNQCEIEDENARDCWEYIGQIRLGNDVVGHGDVEGNK